MSVVPYIYSPGTIIYSAEMNTNLVFLNYTLIDNNKKIQWYNSSAALSAYIVQDSSNNLTVANPSGNFVLRSSLPFVLNNSTNTVSSTLTMGSNLNLTGGAGIGTFDIDFSAGGNAVRFRNSTAILLYNSGNVSRTNITMGTDFDITTLSGGISLNANTHVYTLSGSTNPFVITATGNTELNVGTGNLHVYNSGHTVHVRIYATTGGANYHDIYHDGTNAQWSTGSGDIYITPAGGDVVFRSGTNVRIYDNANTTYGILSMGANFDIVSSAGNITLSPFTSALTINAVTTNNGYIFSQDLRPLATNTWQLGDVSAYWAGAYVNSIISSNVMSFTSATAGGGFDFDANANNSYIKIPTISGSPSSPANGMIWYDTATGDFKGYKGGAVKTFTLT